MELAEFKYVIAGAAGWLVAQALKFLIDLREDGFSVDDLFASGGMPSSHSSFVASVVVVIGISEGFDSAIFGLGLTLLGVVVYDAVGVRRATGENTKTLRAIVGQLKIKNHDTALTMALGHSPYQVIMGLFTGVITGILVNLLVA